jgi:hypothetical protein
MKPAVAGRGRETSAPGEGFNIVCARDRSRTAETALPILGICPGSVSAANRPRLGKAGRARSIQRLRERSAGSSSSGADRALLPLKMVDVTGHGRGGFPALNRRSCPAISPSLGPLRKLAVRNVHTPRLFQETRSNGHIRGEYCRHLQNRDSSTAPFRRT